MWMALLELGIARAWERGITQSKSARQVAIEYAVVTGICTVCHWSIASARVSIRGLVMGAVTVGFILYVYPGYAEIGAEALREAHLGGGTRISYTVRGSRGTTPEAQASGCLVLATSSYVLIGDLDDNSCSPLTRFAFPASEVKARRVRVFSRSEINISEVPGG